MSGPGARVMRNSIEQSSIQQSLGVGLWAVSNGARLRQIGLGLCLYDVIGRSGWAIRIRASMLSGRTTVASGGVGRAEARLMMAIRRVGAAV